MRIKNQLSFLDASIKYKISPSDPLKILFESIDFSFIYTIVKDRYSNKGRHGYDPVSLFKAILLIYFGFANSERDLARKLKFDTRLIYLCGFLFSETPTHATFHYFRKRLGEEIFSEILFTLIAQACAVIKDKNLVLSVDATHIEGFPKDPDARRRKYKIKKQVFIQDGKVFCPGGKKLIYWGKGKEKKKN